MRMRSFTKNRMAEWGFWDGVGTNLGGRERRDVVVAEGVKEWLRHRKG